MDKNKKTEEQLKRQIKSIENEREDIEKLYSGLNKKEEEHEERMQRQFLRLEEMYGECAPNGQEEFMHISECQNLLNQQRQMRTEFLAELKEFRRKKHLELDMREEDIQEELRSISSVNKVE